jgi:hypothetical protein
MRELSYPTLGQGITLHLPKQGSHFKWRKSSKISSTFIIFRAICKPTVHTQVVTFCHTVCCVWQGTFNSGQPIVTPSNDNSLWCHRGWDGPLEVGFLAAQRSPWCMQMWRTLRVCCEDQMFVSKKKENLTLLHSTIFVSAPQKK